MGNERDLFSAFTEELVDFGDENIGLIDDAKKSNCRILPSLNAYII